MGDDKERAAAAAREAKEAAKQAEKAAERAIEHAEKAREYLDAYDLDKGGQGDHGGAAN